MKSFAYETTSVENASVEFNVETLRPTYRVVIGVPGQSNALSIARRLGLSERVLERASTYIDSETIRTDELLGEIRAIRDRAELELQDARQEREDARRIRDEAAEERRNAETERLNAREEALIAAEAELADARAAVRRLQQAAAARPNERPEIERPQVELDKALRQVKDVRRSLSANKPRQQGAVLSIGDRVEVTTLGMEGEIAAIEGDSAEVVMGGLRLRQPLSALKRLGGARKESTRRVSVASGAVYVPMEIDVRGERVADVEAELERYLIPPIARTCRACESSMGRVPAHSVKRCGDSLRRIRRSSAANRVDMATAATASRSPSSTKTKPRRSLLLPRGARRPTRFRRGCHRAPLTRIRPTRQGADASNSV